MASSCSSSSSSYMAKTYDVFVSFRGEDIRYTFLSHLQAALYRSGIKAFVDKQLKRGEEISSSLLKTIEDSYASIVIFSENYAFSPWCLDELVKILFCKQNMGQIVLPVFYGVDPTHVQELRGKFGDAILQHRREFKDSLNKVNIWCHALKETTNLAGLVSDPNKPESKLIDEIINHTWNLLLMDLSNSDNEGLVGIDDRFKRVESLLSENNVIGIWGMGGIGKSTIAKGVYDRIKGQFTSHCFVANVRERFENCMLISMQNEILSAVLGPTNLNEGNCIRLSLPISQMLARRKVCIVLDDVNDEKQVEDLIGKPDIFGPGSVVIITSRDKHLLRLVKATIYEVEALNCNEALYLFCLHAFKQSTPEQEYKALIKRAVKYAQGNPLALKILGSDLYDRSLEEWKDELEKLAGKSNEKIGKILRISYDRLDKDEKEIFLYIACFFNKEDKDHVLSMLDMDGSIIGITRLCEKSLISISENKINMHDLLQQMGKEITCEEAQLGKRMILWHHKDICHLLTRDKRTEAIKAISLDMSKIKNILLNPAAFRRMPNLRYLKFYNSSWRSESKLHVCGEFTYFPDELRLLQWNEYPLDFLPSDSFLENLVELRMPDSELKELWNGAQQLGNLKVLDLAFSKNLSRLPDFSKTPKLEILRLSFCVNLQNLPENLGNAKSLKEIGLSGTAIKELPESICNLECLRRLYIYDCMYLHKLPENLGNLKSLMVLLAFERNQVASSSNQLQKSPWISFDKCEGLFFPCLKTLFLDSCGMSEFPNNLCSLTSLETLNIGDNNFEIIPETIKQLSNLRILRLADCKRLPHVPELPPLKYLFLNNCASLKSVFGSSQSLQKQQYLRELDLINCVNLNQEECNRIIDYAIRLYPYQDGVLRWLRIRGSEVPQRIKRRNSGPYLSFSFSYEQLEEPVKLLEDKQKKDDAEIPRETITIDGTQRKGAN